MHRFIRGQLGPLEKIPWLVKLLLPSLAAAFAWVAFGTVLIELELLPELRTPNAIWGQAGALALASFLAWKWLLVAVFLLHLLNIYVYLGTHPLWSYLSGTARRILAPLSLLHFGKIDLAAVAGIAIVFAVSDLLIKPAVVHIQQRFLT
jgi:hypothetical protein